MEKRLGVEDGGLLGSECACGGRYVNQKREAKVVRTVVGEARLDQMVQRCKQGLRAPAGSGGRGAGGGRDGFFAGAEAVVTARVPLGTIFHFADAPANLLTNDALDPTAKIPKFKVCAAAVREVAYEGN